MKRTQRTRKGRKWKEGISLERERMIVAAQRCAHCVRGSGVECFNVGIRACARNVDWK